MKLWKQASLLATMVVFAGMVASAQNGKGDAAKGKEVYAANCDICHDASTTEDKVGPGLKGITKKAAHKMADGTEHKDHSDAVLRKQITDGSGGMPPLGGSLSAAEIDNVLAYLHTL